MSPTEKLSEAYRIVAAATDGLNREDSARMAYLLARASLAHVRLMRGSEAAAEAAYQLADEAVGGDQ